MLEYSALLFLLHGAGDALQIQCYQCEEMKQNDCSTPEYIVNCTVNVQDMCQKEVLVKPDGKGLFESVCLVLIEVWVFPGQSRLRLIVEGVNVQAGSA